MDEARREEHTAALALVIGVTGATPARGQTAAPCGPFRVEWNVGVLSPTADKLEGSVYNESRCSVSDVRLHVIAVSADGRPVAESLGWVAGDTPAGARAYFALPVPDVPAADYRVDVLSFDQLSVGTRSDPTNAR